MHVLGLQHVLGLSPASIFDFQPIWRAIADFVYARPNGAMESLEKYKEIRINWLHPDSTKIVQCHTFEVK